jgi:hypothetical protein
LGTRGGTWYGGSALVDCSATIIARPLDAMQYFNHTGWSCLSGSLLLGSGSREALVAEAGQSLQRHGWWMVEVIEGSFCSGL